MVGGDIVDESEDAFTVSSASVNNMGQKLMISIPDSYLFPDTGPKPVVWLMQEILAVSCGIILAGVCSGFGWVRYSRCNVRPSPDISVDSELTASKISAGIFFVS